jgi:transcriptional regulator with XRE-family HTH domain
MAMHPIVRYRRAKGWTQTELAREVGVSLNTVQAWEKGSRPRPGHERRLADALGVDPLQFVTEISEWRPEN